VVEDEKEARGDVRALDVGLLDGLLLLQRVERGIGVPDGDEGVVLGGAALKHSGDEGRACGEDEL